MNENPSNQKIEPDDELVFADEDELIFADEQLEINSPSTTIPWKVIIVDDEPSVHQATKLALKKLKFEDKAILFYSAYSGTEAKQLIAEHDDVALIFLDVVMESNDSGLQIVRYIREQLGNKLVRIILRTGQPGDAPEESVIVDYDINDYKLKVELTRQKLLVSAIASLRSYRDLSIISNSRKQLAGLYATLEIARDNLEELVQIRTMELEEEIKQREKISKTLQLTQFSLDRARDAVFFLNGNAQFFYVNEAACQSLGYSQEELLQMTIHQIDPSLASTNWQSYWQELKQQQSLTTESKHQTKDGKTLPVEVTLNHLEFDEHEYNCVIARDITERKQTEAALKKINEKLNHLATIDSLTQLANRRHFDECFHLEWKKMLREQKPLSLLLCDVDFFKTYNDYYGHQAGDDCLRRVAKAIKGSIKRPGDLAARYGGEEFAIILPNTNSQGALNVAESIRTAIVAQKLEHKRSEIRDHITISIGVSGIIPNQSLFPETLIEQSDKALYQAKKNGRNQCYVLNVKKI